MNIKFYRNELGFGFMLNASMIDLTTYECDYYWFRMMSERRKEGEKAMDEKVR